MFILFNNESDLRTNKVKNVYLGIIFIPCSRRKTDTKASRVSENKIAADYAVRQVKIACFLSGLNIIFTKKQLSFIS